jgi:hypothetical protein
MDTYMGAFFCGRDQFCIESSDLSAILQRIYMRRRSSSFEYALITSGTSGSPVIRINKLSNKRYWSARAFSQATGIPVEKVYRNMAVLRFLRLAWDQGEGTTFVEDEAAAFLRLPLSERKKYYDPQTISRILSGELSGISPE